MGILDTLPATIAKAVGPVVFDDLQIYRVSGRTGDGRGSYVGTHARMDARGLVTEYSTFLRMAGNIPSDVKQLIVQGHELASPPLVDDVAHDGTGYWVIVKVEPVPSNAIYECQVRATSFVPVLGPIAGAAAFTLAPFLLAP